MGFFGEFLRRRREREKAIPDSGSSEFESAVRGSALPGSEGVEMGAGGWSSVGDARSARQLGERVARRLGADLSGVEAESDSRTIDLRGSGAREQVEEILRRHGIDPSQRQTVDASGVPGLMKALIGALGAHGVQIPGPGDGPGAAFSTGPDDPGRKLELLKRAHDEGRISAAEFDAQKRFLEEQG